MRPSWPIKMQVDNSAAISFQRQTNPDSRLVGVFDLREKWVQDMRDMKVLETVKVETQLNCADLFTKCLVGGKFTSAVDLIKAKALSF